MYFHYFNQMLLPSKYFEYFLLQTSYRYKQVIATNKEHFVIVTKFRTALVRHIKIISSLLITLLNSLTIISSTSTKLI